MIMHNSMHVLCRCQPVRNQLQARGWCWSWRSFGATAIKLNWTRQMDVFPKQLHSISSIHSSLCEPAGHKYVFVFMCLCLYQGFVPLTDQYDARWNDYSVRNEKADHRSDESTENSPDSAAPVSSKECFSVMRLAHCLGFTVSNFTM